MFIYIPTKKSTNNKTYTQKYISNSSNATLFPGHIEIRG